jgi:hypothetical protein
MVNVGAVALKTDLACPEASPSETSGDGSPLSDVTQAPACQESAEQAKQTLRSALQHHRASVAFHSARLREYQSQVGRLEKALEALGEDCDENPTEGRCEVLRDYLLKHPKEEVTTRAVRANPAKYGIVTRTVKLQMNWLYGRNNPTARKYFEVSNGVIRLRPEAKPSATSNL